MRVRVFRCSFLTHYEGPRQREFVHAVKNCRAIAFGNFAGRDGRELAIELSRQRAQVGAYLRGALLIPIPPSGGGVDKPGDALWSGRDLARGLADAFALEWRELLRRHTPIAKSESCPRTLRRHVESIERCEAIAALPGRRVVLVDDVVTSGSTMCACAQLLWDVAPQLQIDGFAVAYTPDAGDGGLRNFATREYEWQTLDARPRNRLVPGPLDAGRCC